MVIKGRLPKEPEDRVRRNAPRFSAESAVWDGVRRGPDLPDLGRVWNWCKRTQEWWETWRCSPQSMLMTDTDWEWMLETALIHDMLWNGRKEVGGVTVTQLAAELRRRVQAFGASYEDRKKLGMSIETPATKIAEELDDPVGAATVNYAERLKKK